MTDYEMLKAYGFSPQKAAEIALDAERGLAHAKWWLRLARGEAETKAARGRIHATLKSERTNHGVHESGK